MSADVPPSFDIESGRLARLRELLVLDTAPEPLFDSLARLASEVCGVPIALLSLIDAERQWFKANVGLPGVNETPRDVAFCDHAIRGDGLFEVPDATRDPRFVGNPLVAGAPDIRFYAGAPLVLASGERIGTLCVIDREARQLDAGQRQMLQRLARIAMEALVMRRELIDKSLAVRSSYEQALSQSEAQHRAIVEAQAELVSLASADGTLVYTNPAYARFFGRTAEQMAGANLYDFVESAHREAVRTRIAAVFVAGVGEASENRMLDADGTERWVSWTNSVQQGPQGEPLLRSVGRDITDLRRAELALRASQAFLTRTGRVAGVGGWELDFASGTVTWSDETRRIHEVGPDYQPTLATAVRFYPPNARAQVEEAMRVGMESGQGWDLELPFVTATGRDIWVRAVGEVEYEGGRPVRLVGAFQDVNERVLLTQRLSDNERFLRLVTDNLPVHTAYVDREQRYRFVNEANCRLFGRPREQILGRTLKELIPGGVDSGVYQRVDAALAGQAQHFEHEEWVGGQLRRIESRLIPDFDAAGEVRGCFSTGIDVTERSASEKALRLQTATLASVTEAIPAIVSAVDADLRFRFVNSAFERWYGRSREQVLGRRAIELFAPEDHALSLPWAERALAGETVQFERSYPDRPGTPHLAVSYIPLRLDNGRLDGFIGVAQDITPHREEQQRLQHLAQRDPLTGLLNRAGFELQMSHVLEGGDGANLALLYIDLDRFKPVNDTHGHSVGDLVLQAFAQRLSRLVRPSDAVARMGGDEFALLLPGMRDKGHARVVADKVIAAATTPFEVAGLVLHIGASVGVAHGADPATGGRELLARADARLYQAKQAGRGRQAGEGA